ncbi:hypothetical protein Poli38472_009706 [Pythium oligandrum]|uniref:Uncharacterized protein n=1 Tax=Pythium oligandrum TaxID=41045 RepID=A0A8K1CGR4_PYTOL|nr:hypothetical protein Poli38472_009706 [Pythium oligandrum]|eukprot:TMW62213.1 hypothetical protein Poli38472_009706 [Pythium oligandrum]
MPVTSEGGDMERSAKLNQIEETLRYLDMPLKQLEDDAIAQDRLRKVLDSVHGVDTQLLQKIHGVYINWLHSADGKLTSDALWVQLVRFAVLLETHPHGEQLRSSATQDLLASTLAPASVPSKTTFCDHSRQQAFVIQLFDAVFGIESTRAMTKRLGVLIDYVRRAMKDYEFVFLRHVAEELMRHVHATRPKLPAASMVKELTQFVNGLPPRQWEKQASELSIAVLLLTAVGSDNSNVQKTLSRVCDYVASGISSQEALPHVHSHLAILASCLEPFASSHTTTPSCSVLQLFLCYRTMNLVFASPKLLVSEEESKRRWSNLHTSVQIAARTDPTTRSTILAMIEAYATEVTSAFQRQMDWYSALLSEFKEKSGGDSKPVLRPSLLALQDSLPAPSVFPVRAYLAVAYDVLLRTCNALSEIDSAVLLRCFSVMTKLEFARELLANPAHNAQMVDLTMQVESLVDTAPNSTLSTLSHLVLAPTVNQELSPALDVVSGWTTLTVGLLFQRKLRVILFQASETIRQDVLAVVFAGLGHGLEPLDEFANRFLLFCVSSLTTFLSIYSVFPHYLQVTLIQFPDDIGNDRVANVLGTIFGALYYTQDEESESRRQQMIVWGMRQIRTRTIELLSVKKEEHDASTRASGLYLTELFLEIVKLAPLVLLPTVAREMETLVEATASDSELLKQVKHRVLEAISQNCEAEKRAWFAAWFLELDAQYPVVSTVSESPPTSRL